MTLFIILDGVPVNSGLVSSFIDNLFLIAYEMTNGVNSNTVVGNLSASYEITSDLDNWK